jgi:hypothetical protein
MIQNVQKRLTTHFKNFTEKLNPRALLQQDQAPPHRVYLLANFWTYGLEAVSQLHGLKFMGFNRHEFLSLQVHKGPGVPHTSHLFA